MYSLGSQPSFALVNKCIWLHVFVGLFCMCMYVCMYEICLAFSHYNKDFHIITVKKQSFRFMLIFLLLKHSSGSPEAMY